MQLESGCFEAPGLVLKQAGCVKRTRSSAGTMPCWPTLACRLHLRLHVRLDLFTLASLIQQGDSNSGS